MPKSCPNCSASNKDEALFCKACGCSLADVQADAPFDPMAAGSITCSDCGHVNRPGTRYCARCGVNMEGTVILPRPRAAEPAPAATYYAPQDQPYAAHEPYERTQTYPPAPAQTYPPAPAQAYAEPEASDDTLPPPQAEWEPEPPPPAPAPAPPAPKAASSSPLLWIALIVFAAVALGGGLWWFLSRPLAPPPEAKVEQPAPVVAPAALPDPAALAASAAAAAAAASAAEAAAMPPVATVPPPPDTTPATAPTAPVTATPEATPNPPSASASVLVDPAREAALRQARDKARRDKAEAEAKAKLAAQQRDQDAARAKAEQDAAARRRAEERQARQLPPQPAPQAAPARVQTVDEICAGRNLISLGICENRECASPVHANESTCKKIYEREERRKFN